MSARKKIRDVSERSGSGWRFSGDQKKKLESRWERKGCLTEKSRRGDKGIDK